MNLQKFSGSACDPLAGLRPKPACLPSPATVYTAQSLSLAALEQFVHLGPEDNHIQFVSFRVEIPEDLNIDKLESDKLPVDWRMEPPPDSTRRIGTQWAESGRSAVLRLPSVIIPTEYNYALNPTHPDFRRIRIEEPKQFSFDPRMWKRS